MLKGPSRLRNRRSMLLRRHPALGGLLAATMVVTIRQVLKQPL